MNDDASQSSFLRYLPAIFARDPYLGKFLKPFEEVLTGYNRLLADVDRYFSPQLTDPEFLPWLATWMALVLDEEWDEADRRRLIGEAVELYRWRGTVTGLKRYLEIYTGLVPEIREWRWPGGMQIGVASRIGGTMPADAAWTKITRMVRDKPLVYYHYYIIDTVAAAGHPEPEVSEGDPIQIFYRTDRVQRVEVDQDQKTVDIWYLPSEEGPAIPRHYEPASIGRRDQLIDEHYMLTIDAQPESQTVAYSGDTVLIDEEEYPYRFTVDVRVPLAGTEKFRVLDKVRAIVDLEKPAHTIYYLKLTPVVSAYVLESMQIGVHSTIALDTTVG
jgi:phage tail-like protein